MTYASPGFFRGALIVAPGRCWTSGTGSSIPVLAVVKTVQYRACTRPGDLPTGRMTQPHHRNHGPIAEVATCIKFDIPVYCTFNLKVPSGLLVTVLKDSCTSTSLVVTTSTETRIVVLLVLVVVAKCASALNF
jgi:hypothetical protein